MPKATVRRRSRISQSLCEGAEGRWRLTRSTHHVHSFYLLLIQRPPLKVPAQLGLLADLLSYLHTRPRPHRLPQRPATQPLVVRLRLDLLRPKELRDGRAGGLGPSVDNARDGLLDLGAIRKLCVWSALLHGEDEGREIGESVRVGFGVGGSIPNLRSAIVEVSASKSSGGDGLEKSGKTHLVVKVLSVEGHHALKEVFLAET